MNSSRNSLIVVVLMAAGVLAYMISSQLSWTAGELGAPLDDAWIHAQYARNLVQGDGFSYNAGEPTPGSTAPLWTILLTLPALIALDQLLVGSLVLSALFFGMAAVLVAWGLRVEFGSALTHSLPSGGIEGGESSGNHALKRTGLGMVAGVATVCVGRFAWAGWSGMEATAFAAVSLAAVLLYMRFGLNFWVGIMFGLASQLRPEGHALVLLAGLIWLWDGRREIGRSIRIATVSALGYVLVSLPYIVFSLRTTGRPLPNTFYAKASTDAAFFSVRTLQETVAYHWQDNPVSLLLVPFGMIAVAKMGGSARRWLLPAWLIGLPLFTSVIVDAVWHHGRYTLPLIPFQVLLATLGIGWLGRTKWITVLLSLALVVGSVVGLPKWAEMLGKNSREIIEIDVAMGNWLRENTRPDAVIAVDDIGAIGYLSERKIFDLQGLISPEMWPIMRDVEIGLPRNQATTRLLADVQPDYLAIFPTWHYELAINGQVSRPVADFRTDTHTIIFAQDARVFAFESPYFPSDLPEIERDALFAERIRLRGYSVGNGTIAFEWEAAAPIAQSYALFVHFLDANGTIVAQIDGRPGSDLFGTNAWRVGDVVRDVRPLPLPVEAWQTVNVGWYLPETGVRLPVGAGDVFALYPD